MLKKILKIIVLVLFLLLLSYLLYIYLSPNISNSQVKNFLNNAMRLNESEHSSGTVFGEVEDEYSLIYENPQVIAPNNWGVLVAVEGDTIKVKDERDNLNVLQILHLAEKIWFVCQNASSDDEKVASTRLYLDYRGMSLDTLKGIRDEFQNGSEVAQILEKEFIGSSIRFNSREENGLRYTDHIMVLNTDYCERSTLD